MASKKIDLDFVLSDSSVNVYGFRLVTSGYLIEEFLKNPIGYYGHEQEDGVLVRWDEVRIDGDRILGKPVVNLEHPRGERTVTEIEEGFLNAASLGNIVVLEFHAEESGNGQEDVVVVDKWYNKECSLVDNPGNREAFRTELADSDGSIITVQDLMGRSGVAGSRRKSKSDEIAEPRIADGGFKKVELTLTNEVLEMLDLGDVHDEGNIVRRLREMKESGNKLRLEIDAANKQVRMNEVKEILERGLNDGRLTQAAKAELELHFTDNPEALGKLVGSFPVYQSIAERLGKIPDEIRDLSDMSYDELDKADKLVLLLEKAPGLYKEKYQRKFGKAPANV